MLQSVAARSQHEFSYQATLRRLAQLTPTASIRYVQEILHLPLHKTQHYSTSIREAAGTTLKSSLTHTWNYGTTDTVTPNDSFHIKTFQV